MKSRVGAYNSVLRPQRKPGTPRGTLSLVRLLKRFDGILDSPYDHPAARFHHEQKNLQKPGIGAKPHRALAAGPYLEQGLSATGG